MWKCRTSSWLDLSLKIEEGYGFRRSFIRCELERIKRRLKKEMIAWIRSGDKRGTGEVIMMMAENSKWLHQDLEVCYVEY